ncbi:hypothetical protein [Ehrlichia ruminantium]|uniref:hypothetical protein n=1 Tax=Ehrlichia ruminantium TaxID=779 RepID=UPI00130D9F05|nr:hypothetical protein [Ehrlichia ruminantium]
MCNSMAYNIILLRINRIWFSIVKWSRNCYGIDGGIVVQIIQSFKDKLCAILWHATKFFEVQIDFRCLIRRDEQ